MLQMLHNIYLIDMLAVFLGKDLILSLGGLCECEQTAGKRPKPTVRPIRLRH